MRNLKRVLSLALALVMVLGMMVITTSAADFTDADEITYTEAVEVMSAIGIIEGYNGSFNPKGTLTREGAAKILAFVCLGTEADDYLTGSTADPFTDVAADRWSAKYVTYCKNLGIINGVDAAGTVFNPTGNISIVGFAKLLLGAIGAEGTYTGAGWEDNVKNAVAEVPTLAATGIKITNADITREEACELALAAMKAGETYSNGWYIVGYEEAFGYSDSYADAYIMAKAMDIASPEIEKHTDTRDSLLEDLYDVEFDPDDADKFGRPGNSYTYTVDEEEVVLFFVDEALAKFEGPVAQEDLYAASGYKTDNALPYTVIQDGVEIGDWTADKAEGDHAEEFAAGTGFGIKTELYKDGDDYNLIAIRDYLGTVAVNEVEEDEDRSITVTLDVVPTACESTQAFTLETEAFEDDDVVIVTMAGTEIMSIALAETVKGTPTKIATGSGSVDTKTYTIGGDTYVVSQTTYVVEGGEQGSSVVVELGEEAEWYVDSFGNLIGNVDPVDEEDPAPVYYYGYLLGYAAQDYAPAGSGDLLGANATEEKAAKEVFKFVDASGETVVLYGAVEVNEEDETDFVADQWAVYAKDQDPSNDAKDILFVYELDEDGNISYAAAASSSYTANNGAVTVEKGKAKVGAKYMTNDTVFFFIDDEDEISVYTGYNNVPNTTSGIGSARFLGTDTDFLAALLVTEAEIDDGFVPTTNYVYFADDVYTTEWDAAANDGEGDTFVLYENVYINGVKAAEGLKFADVQSDVEGKICTYTTSSTTGLSTITGTVVDTASDGTEVTLVQETYFKANTITYTDDDTVFWQVDKTAKTITVVDAIAVPTQELDVFVQDITSDDGVAVLVIFYTAEA